MIPPSPPTPPDPPNAECTLNAHADCWRRCRTINVTLEIAGVPGEIEHELSDRQRDAIVALLDKAAEEAAMDDGPDETERDE